LKTLTVLPSVGISRKLDKRLTYIKNVRNPKLRSAVALRPAK
jgi:hypothetical protein